MPAEAEGDRMSSAICISHSLQMGAVCRVVCEYDNGAAIKRTTWAVVWSVGLVISWLALLRTGRPVSLLTTGRSAARDSRLVLR